VEKLHNINTPASAPKFEPGSSLGKPDSFPLSQRQETKFTENSRFLKAAGHSVNLETTHPIKKPNVHYRIHSIMYHEPVEFTSHPASLLFPSRILLSSQIHRVPCVVSFFKSPFETPAFILSPFAKHVFKIS
jgi:hypothetical protein